MGDFFGVAAFDFAFDDDDDDDDEDVSATFALLLFAAALAMLLLRAAALAERSCGDNKQNLYQTTIDSATMANATVIERTSFGCSAVIVEEQKERLTVHE